jgi:hypothetical protein
MAATNKGTVAYSILKLIVRVMNFVFVAIILISGFTIAVTGSANYKGIESEGLGTRLAGVMFTLSGLYFLKRLIWPPKSDDKGGQE